MIIYHENMIKKPELGIDDKMLFTIPDVAAILSCSQRKVYYLIEEGVIPTTNNMVGYTRISREALKAAVAAQESAA